MRLSKRAVNLRQPRCVRIDDPAIVAARLEAVGTAAAAAAAPHAREAPTAAMAPHGHDPSQEPPRRWGVFVVFVFHVLILLLWLFLFLVMVLYFVFLFFVALTPILMPMAAEVDVALFADLSSGAGLLFIVCNRERRLVLVRVRKTIIRPRICLFLLFRLLLLLNCLHVVRGRRRNLQGKLLPPPARSI